MNDKTVKEVLSRLGINKKRRKIEPKSTEKQKEKQLKCIKKLYREGPMNLTCDTEIVIDDECYLTLDGNRWHENDFYFDCDTEEIPDEVRYLLLEKFLPKLMVWMAISSRGRSSVYFVPSKLGVNREIYIKECINKRLVPFIKKHYSDDNYIFWPDLAPAHCAIHTQNAMNRLNIKFIPKYLNPPAVPQLRPIESFWAIYKRAIYENGWSANTPEEFRKRATKVF
jgi:hypothetical protein